MLRKCGIIILLTFICLPAVFCAESRTPWIFFDLGKTIIDHAEDYSNMRYLPEALDYLKHLKQRGYHLGLLINWPESEGKDNAEKLVLLKEFIQPKWVDQNAFDWSMFDAILFPPKDIYQKPHPYLFIEALRIAAPCAVVYQGEEPDEIKTAQDLGLTAHCVRGSPVVPGSLLSVDEIPTRISESFIYTYPSFNK